MLEVPNAGLPAAIPVPAIDCSFDRRLSTKPRAAVLLVSNEPLGGIFATEDFPFEDPDQPLLFRTRPEGGTDALDEGRYQLDSHDYPLLSFPSLL